MTQQVTDTASHAKAQIANFAGLLKNSPARQKVFEAVYFGKKESKTAAEVAASTGYSQKRVTEIAKPLSRLGLFDQGREKRKGVAQTVYRKIGFVTSNKGNIFRRVRNRRLLEKTHPHTQNVTTTIHVRAPFKAQTEFVSIDDVHQFRKVKAVSKVPDSLSPPRLPEAVIKTGILRLLREDTGQKDWGGENNDIFSVRLNVGNKKLRGAFALKGPGKKGPLVPGKMGKNGDQIQRLFSTPADVFFVQYEDEIKESVVQLMEQLAKAKALLGGKIRFGIIDRRDTYRLRVAYPGAFKKANSRSIGRRK